MEAFCKFVKEYPNFEFRIVGVTNQSDRYNEKVRAYIQRHELPVVYMGPLSHAALLHQFQSCTAHVLPSISEPFYFEGFGLVHLEANSCGALTIGTKNSANEEIIAEGMSGFLVPQNNAAAVASAMRSAIEKISREKERVREQCVKHARKFSWSNSVASIRRAYRQDY